MTNRKAPLNDRDKEAARRLKAIYAERKAELKLTHEKLAEIAGLGTQGAVSHYLNGRNPIGLEAGLKFAMALQVPPSSINKEWAVYDPVIDQEAPRDPRRKALYELIKHVDDETIEALLALLKTKQ